MSTIHEAPIEGSSLSCYRTMNIAESILSPTVKTINGYYCQVVLTVPSKAPAILNRVGYWVKKCPEVLDSTYKPNPRRSLATLTTGGRHVTYQFCLSRVSTETLENRPD